MNTSRRRLLRIITGIFFSFLFIFPVYASNTTDKIKELEKEKNAIEENAKNTKDRIADLENSKGSLESYLDNLDTQFTEISEQLADLETQLMIKEEEILLTKIDLENAKSQEAKQYADMKMRIQFMYENGNRAYIDILLSSDNISDLLNKAEYIAKITEYDRSMLTKYQETKEAIADTEQLLAGEEAQLLALQEEVAAKHVSVAALMETTSMEISQFSNEISSAEKLALSYESQLEEQQSSISNLKKQKAAEEAAAKKAADLAAAEKAAAELAKNSNTNNGGTTSPPPNNTGGTPSDDASAASDLALLAAIIQCEADGESYEGKLAVGSVVMNRVRSGAYPNTILGVLYQKSQFSPVTSGRFAIVLTRGANSTCIAAAEEVLNGNITINTLHFRTVVPWISGIVIGNHVFY